MPVKGNFWASCADHWLCKVFEESEWASYYEHYTKLEEKAGVEWLGHVNRIGQTKLLTARKLKECGNAQTEMVRRCEERKSPKVKTLKQNANNRYSKS